MCVGGWRAWLLVQPATAAANIHKVANHSVYPRQQCLTFAIEHSSFPQGVNVNHNALKKGENVNQIRLKSDRSQVQCSAGRDGTIYCAVWTDRITRQLVLVETVGRFIDVGRI